MSKNYLIIGGVAGGATIAARLRRLDEGASITMLEKGRDVSFSNCALPYFLGGEIETSSELVLSDPETFLERYRIRALTFHEALSIDRENKTVEVKDLQSGQVKHLPYDDLFLSPGASPIMPRAIPGITLPQVFSVRNVQDVEKIDHWLSAQKVREAVVVGGGFIGVEVAENLRQRGLIVSLADLAPQVMLPFDSDMAQILHRELMDQGISLHLGDGLLSIQQDRVTLNSGKQIPAQMVVMAIGVLPETGLAKAAGLALGSTGAIKVNQCMQTSDPHIYAVGDAIELNNFFTGQPQRLALAGPAIRQARLAADCAAGRPPYALPGAIGASVIRVFGLSAASTGLNERQLQAEGLDYGLSLVLPNDRVGIMPGASPVFFKLLYQKGTGRVLGAQAISQGAADKRIDVVSTLIRYGGTIWELKDLELAYAPHFGTARDVVSLAALSACDQEEGLVKNIQAQQVRGLLAEGAFFLDVREEDEYAYAHIKGALNIPLGQLRQRMEELPRDRPIYVHCRSGQRSYNAARALMQHGFEEVYNLAGSMAMLSQVEYFSDKSTGRQPILTGYCL